MIHQQSRALELATATLTAAAATTGVLVLADAGRERDGVARLDPHVASGILDIRSGPLTHLAHALTLLGSEPVVGTLAVLLFIVLLERRGQVFALIAAAGMAVSVGLTVGVKILVERPRPGAVDRLGPVDHSYSFPSGHTLNSTVLLGLAVILLLPLIRARPLRATAAVGAILMALAIGWSRIYLGYHWTTDVIASWLLASAILVGVHVATRLVPGEDTMTIAVLTPLLVSLGPAALLVVMAIVFAESGLLIGFFLPGDSLLFLAGAFVASDVIGLPLWLLMLGVALAAVAGDQVGYVIGRRLGSRVFSRPDSRLFSRSHADAARRFFDRHGSKAVILARFVPIVRTFVPVVAGIGRMPRRRFTAYNIVGGVTWSAGILAAGYWFGGIAVIAAHIELITIGCAGLSVVPALVAYVRRRRSRARVDAAPQISQVPVR